MRATVPLQARKGRASYLGERSIGHQDPGATSTALIIAALEQCGRGREMSERRLRVSPAAGGVAVGPALVCATATPTRRAAARGERRRVAGGAQARRRRARRARGAAALRRARRRGGDLEANALMARGSGARRAESSAALGRLAPSPLVQAPSARRGCSRRSTTRCSPRAPRTCARSARRAARLLVGAPPRTSRSDRANRDRARARPGRAGRLAWRRPDRGHRARRRRRHVARRDRGPLARAAAGRRPRRRTLLDIAGRGALRARRRRGLGAASTRRGGLARRAQPCASGGRRSASAGRDRARRPRSRATGAGRACSATRARAPRSRPGSTRAPRASGCSAPSSPSSKRRRWPSEAEHASALAPLLAPLAHRIATVRTLDFGGDKTPPFLAGSASAGSRCSLAPPGRVAAQLRAIFAAGAATRAARPAPDGERPRGARVRALLRRACGEGRSPRSAR